MEMLTHAVAASLTLLVVASDFTRQPSQGQWLYTANIRYTDSNGHSTPPAQFLASLGASFRAQRMADSEYYVHWSRHLLVSIRQATGAEALIGASAVIHNPHITSFLSPFVCDQSLGALSQ